jgi:uncharacterized membrane protein
MSNPIKPTIKSEILSWSIMVISVAASFYFYRHFPAKVVTHWDLAGRPNGWSGPAFAAFFFPLLLVIIYFLLLFIPLIDPKKERYAEFAKTYNIFRNLIILMLAVIYFIASLKNLGYGFDIKTWVAAIVGLLFIILGNYLGKIKPNWFVGIRTPWTLSSETVWNKTHRFGGKVFVVCGFLLILTGFLPAAWRLPLFAADIIILVFGTIIYSYFAYWQERTK